MQIGDLARATGTTTKTIRYYEDIGVLPLARRGPNGYRLYDPEAAERLRFVKDAQATGLTLEEIASVLELREQGTSTCGHVLGLLEHHLDDLDHRIAALQGTRRELRAMIDRARQLDPAECLDPNRCQTIDRTESKEAPSASVLGEAPAAHRHRPDRPGHPAHD